MISRTVAREKKRLAKTTSSIPEGFVLVCSSCGDWTQTRISISEEPYFGGTYPIARLICTNPECEEMGKDV